MTDMPGKNELKPRYDDAIEAEWEEIPDENQEKPVEDVGGGMSDEEIRESQRKLREGVPDVHNPFGPKERAFGGNRADEKTVVEVADTSSGKEVVGQKAVGDKSESMQERIARQAEEKRKKNEDRDDKFAKDLRKKQEDAAARDARFGGDGTRARVVDAKLGKKDGPKVTGDADGDKKDDIWAQIDKAMGKDGDKAAKTEPKAAPEPVITPEPPAADDVIPPDGGLPISGDVLRPDEVVSPTPAPTPPPPTPPTPPPPPAAETAEVEPPIDQVRADFMKKVMQHISTGQGSVNTLSKSDIDKYMHEVRANDSFTEEAIALVAMFHMSTAKQFIQSNMGSMVGVMEGQDVGKQVVGDIELERLFRQGYKDEFLRNLLETQSETEKKNISKAWNIYLRMAKGELGPIPAPWAVELSAKLVKGLSKDDEDAMIRDTAIRRGISEYEARIGFMMFEAFNEAEYSSKHPFYSLTHPVESADFARKINIWRGSEGWFEIVEVRGRKTNGMPERLWLPAGEMKLIEVGGNKYSLGEYVMAGKGVEVLLDLLDGNGENANLLLNSHKMAGKAVKLQKQLMEIGPGTPSAKFEQKMLVRLREDLLELVSKEHVTMAEAKRTLYAAVRVYFWEMSAENPRYIEIEDKVIRLMSPVALFERYLKLARYEVAADGSRKGFFDLGDGDDGLGNMERTRLAVIDHIEYVMNEKNPAYSKVPSSQQVRGLVGRLKKVMPKRTYLTQVEAEEMWEKAKDRGFGLGKREF